MESKRSGFEIKRFNKETEEDALFVINSYISSWPYSRKIDNELLSYWKTLEASCCPDNMLIGYQDKIPLAFLHGEDKKDEFAIHLLALLPGAAAAGERLLAEAEKKAKIKKAKIIQSPYAIAGDVYGGYILGREPYTPHWAVDSVEAYVRAGFKIAHPALILIYNSVENIEMGKTAPDYKIEEAGAALEFKAETFRYVAFFEGQEVATCSARLYPEIKTAGGGPTGQIGFVGTNEAHRGKGLARSLTKLSLTRLKKMGAEEVLIATGLENYPALRAYEKCGFKRRYNINEWSKELRQEK